MCLNLAVLSCSIYVYIIQLGGGLLGLLFFGPTAVTPSYGGQQQPSMQAGFPVSSFTFLGLGFFSAVGGLSFLTDTYVKSYLGGKPL